jgi:hypothetical protein
VLDQVTQSQNGTQAAADQVAQIVQLVADLSAASPDTDWNARVTEKIKDWTGRPDAVVTSLSVDEAADAIEKLTQAKLLLADKAPA